MLDLLRYLLAAAFLTLAGVGFLRCLRCRFEPAITWLLAPAVGQALWAIAVGAVSVLRIPLHHTALPVFGGTALLAMIALRPWPAGRPPIRLLLLATILPIVLLLPYFRFGLADYRGNRLPDGWSYVAYGQYLWDYPRGAEGGLEPVYQYASHASETRHVAAGELGLFAEFAAADEVQSGTGLFLAVSFFSLAAAAGAYATAVAMPVLASSLIILLTTVCGWMLNVVRSNNFDNIAALAAFPALAAIAAAPWERTDLGRWCVLGVVLAGLFYTYPELAMMVGGVIAVMVAERQWRAGWRAAAAAAGCAAVFLALSAPYLRAAANFVLGQLRLSEATVGARPGEGYFPGLQDPRFVGSAFWGLGGELNAPHLRLQLLCAAALFLLFAAGVLRLVRERQFGLLAALVLPAVGAPLILIRSGYGYGAYKLILMGWWALAFTVVSGAFWVSTRNRLAGVLAVAMCCTLPAVATIRVGRALSSPPEFGIDRFRTVSNGLRQIGTAPVGVAVADWEASEWAVYFLRHGRTRLGDFDMYLAMPHVRTRLARSADYPWPQMRYVLTDAVNPSPTLRTGDWAFVWGNAAYSLWDTGSSNWAIASDLNYPNGVGHVAPPRSIEIAPQMHFAVLARRAACLRLGTELTASTNHALSGSFHLLASGRSVPPADVELGSGSLRFNWPLHSGENEITATAASSGMAGTVQIARLESRLELPPAIDRIDNPNGIDQSVQGLVWLGGGTTRLHIVGDVAGPATLTAIFQPGPSVAQGATSARVRVRELPAGESRIVSLTRGPGEVPVTLTRGETIVELEPLDNRIVAVQPNGDRRPLILAMQGAELVVGCR